MECWGCGVLEVAECWGLRSAGVAEYGGCGVRWLRCVGVLVYEVTFWVSCGVCICSIFIQSLKFSVSTILTLELCYDQTEDPGTLWIV